MRDDQVGIQGIPGVAILGFPSIQNTGHFTPRLKNHREQRSSLVASEGEFVRMPDVLEVPNRFSGEAFHA